MIPSPSSTRFSYLSVALVSAAALASEVLLTRLFSIIQWHHFAYMIISLALLGYGASGTFLSLFREWLERHFSWVYVLNLLLFGITSLGSYLLAQQIPFNAEELLWDATQPLRLAANYLLLAIPFFFAANAIGLALLHHPRLVGRIYGADLAGAAIGSGLALALLFLLPPLPALGVVSAVGIAAATVAAFELRIAARRSLSILLAAVAGIVLLTAFQQHLAISPYKPLEQLMQVEGAQIVDERSSPLGLLTLVENSNVPLRHAPGLSLLSPATPPEQIALFTDADALNAITKTNSDLAGLNYLDYMSSALPYHFGIHRVLIPAAGTGSEVLQALLLGARKIDAVELNPQVVELLKDDYAEFAANLYTRPEVDVHIADNRGFISTAKPEYDLIQLTLGASFGSSGAGLYALSETYTLTLEAFQDYLAKLRPGGYLSLTSWITIPPRPTLKLVATAIAALKKRRSAEPAQQLLLIRGWQTATLLVKNGHFTAEEIDTTRRFCAQRAFDMAYYPGMPPTEANRYNRLANPYFYQGTQKMLGEDASRYLDAYKFDLTPATDDRPYFYHFLRWRTLPEIFAARERGGYALLEWGFLIPLLTLMQAVMASLLLIVLPLWRGHQEKQAGRQRWRVLIFFSGIGLAFFFIEIALMQRFILYLHHPVYAVTTVLALFLLSAGAGSTWTARRETGARRLLLGAATAIALLTLIITVSLPALFSITASAPLLVKMLICATVLLPLGFSMGIPFPTALTVLARNNPPLVPWAWAINGCASVVGTALASIFAVEFGFRIVLLLAIGLYLVATMLLLPIAVPATKLPSSH